jgi:hypothetical protein
MEQVKAVQVNLWGQFVGAVAPLKNKPGFYEFSYSPEFGETPPACRWIWRIWSRMPAAH